MCFVWCFIRDIVGNTCELATCPQVAAAGTSRRPSTVALSRRRPSGLSPDSASSQARLNDSVARSHSIAQQLHDEAASHDNHRARVKRHARLARQRGARSRDEMGVKHGHVGTHPHTTVRAACTSPAGPTTVTVLCVCVCSTPRGPPQDIKFRPGNLWRGHTIR